MLDIINADTIVAIATPPGKGGVGIIRLSGSAALQVAKACFRFREQVKKVRSNYMLSLIHISEPTRPY